MTRPLTSNFDLATGIDESREMTDEEYAALLESGWTPGEEDTPE